MLICSKGRTDTATTMETSPVRCRRNSGHGKRHGRGSGSRHGSSSRHRNNSRQHRSGSRHRSNSRQHRSGSRRHRNNSGHRSNSRQRRSGSGRHRLSDSVMTFHQAGKKFNTDLAPAQGTLLAAWLEQNPQADSRKAKDKKWEKLLKMFHSGFDKKFTRDFYWCSFPLIAPTEYWDNNSKNGPNIKMSEKIMNIVGDGTTHKTFNFFKRSHTVFPENWNATKTPVLFENIKLGGYGTGTDVLKQIMLNDGGRNRDTTNKEWTQSVMEMLEAVVTFMFYIFHEDPFARESNVTDVAVAWPFFHQPRVCATIPLFHDYPNNPVWDRFPFQDERNAKFRELIRQNHKTGDGVDVMNVPESLIPKLRSDEAATSNDKANLKKLYTSEYKKDSVWKEWKEKAPEFEGMFRGITSIIEVVLRDSITDGSRFPTRVDMGLPDYSHEGLDRNAQIIGVRRALGVASLPGDKVLTSQSQQHGPQYMHGLPRERLPPPKPRGQRKQRKSPRMVVSEAANGAADPQQRTAEEDAIVTALGDTEGDSSLLGRFPVSVSPNPLVEDWQRMQVPASSQSNPSGGVVPQGPWDPSGISNPQTDGLSPNGFVRQPVYYNTEGKLVFASPKSNPHEEDDSSRIIDGEADLVDGGALGNVQTSSSLEDLERQEMLELLPFLQSKTNSKVFRVVQQLAKRIHKERANSKSPMQVSPLALLEDMLGSNSFHQTAEDTQISAWDMALGGQPMSSQGSNSSRKSSKGSKSPKRGSPKRGSPKRGPSRKSSKGLKSPRKSSKGSKSSKQGSSQTPRFLGLPAFPEAPETAPLGFENHSFDYLVVYHYSDEDKNPVTLEGRATPYSMEWVREEYVSRYDSFPLWKSQGEALLANGYEFPDDGGFFMPVQVPGTRMVRFRTGGSSKDKGKTGKGVYYSILP